MHKKKIDKLKKWIDKCKWRTDQHKKQMKVKEWVKTKDRNTNKLIVKIHKKYLIFVNMKIIMKQTTTQVSEK